MSSLINYPFIVLTIIANLSVKYFGMLKRDSLSTYDLDYLVPWWQRNIFSIFYIRAEWIDKNFTTKCSY